MLSRDSKRIQGPLKTNPISNFITDRCKKDENITPLFDEDGHRKDGRMPDELLPIYLRTGMNVYYNLIDKKIEGFILPS